MNQNARTLGQSLSRIGFSSVLDGARTACAHPYEAWIESDLPNTLSGIPQGAMITPVHQCKNLQTKTVSQLGGLLDELAAAEVIQIDGDVIRPGKWQLTAYKGILAARDTPVNGEDSRVYIGEDSLHFVDWIASAPRGTNALDIGAGSGISSVALARRVDHVTAVDIDEDCCRAIPFTAELNGVLSQIDTVLADVTLGLKFNHQFDLIVGNTPGVPVPAHLKYSPAGNGGEDGLFVSRSVLDQLPKLLSANGTALLKFESAGDDTSPKSEKILREMAEKYGWSVLFVQHSRIPMEVRSAISTRWATPLNPTLGTNELLAEFDKHARKIGATQFYTCTAQIKSKGDGKLTTLPVYGYGDWVIESESSVAISTIGTYSDDALTGAYLERMRILPDGLWELDLRNYLFLPLVKAREIAALQSEFRTFGELVRSIFGKELAVDPIHARSLYVLTAIMLDGIQSLK